MRISLTFFSRYPEDKFDSAISNLFLLLIGNKKFEEEINEKINAYLLFDKWQELLAKAVADKIEQECWANRFVMPVIRIPIKILPKTATLAQSVFLTDAYGHITYPIKDIDGQLLPTDTMGSPLNRLGEKIEYDEVGNPLGPDGKILHKDEQGNFVYPAIDNFGRLLPTDENGRAVYPIANKDGLLLPTNELGIAVDDAGYPIPTNAAGRPISPDGSLLPFGEDGNIIFAEQATEKIAPTDVTGRIISIVWPDKKLLSTDASGYYVDNLGRRINMDEQGRPIGPNGIVLPTHDQMFVHPQLDKWGKPLPTDINGKPIYMIIDAKDLPLSNVSEGLTVDQIGAPISTDEAGRPLGPSGSVLPTNADGDYILTKAEETKCDKIDSKANIVFLIESTDAMISEIDRIKMFLHGFIAENLDLKRAKIGIVTYGETVEINIDIGNYKNMDELLESLKMIQPIGGTSEGNEHAIRTALHLLLEKHSDETGELIIYLHKTPIRLIYKVPKNGFKFIKLSYYPQIFLHIFYVSKVKISFFSFCR